MNETVNSEQRRARIRLETPRYRMEGFLTLPRDGYRSRVSDYLNAAQRGPFLSLSDVTVQSLEDHSSEQYPFLAVSRGQIVFLVELDTEPSPAA